MFPKVATTMRHVHSCSWGGGGHKRWPLSASSRYSGTFAIKSFQELLSIVTTKLKQNYISQPNIKMRGS
jgi:hypothetical protein